MIRTTAGGSTASSSTAPRRSAPPRALSPADADTGYGLWVLGQPLVSPLTDGRIVADPHERARRGRPDLTGRCRTPDRYPGRRPCEHRRCGGSRVLLSGSGSGVTAGLWCIDVESGATSPCAEVSPSMPNGCRALCRSRSTEGTESCTPSPTPGEPRRDSPRRRAPPVRGAGARRTDRARPGAARQPTRSTRAGESACSTSTTAAPPATDAPTANAWTADGASWTSTT